MNKFSLAMVVLNMGVGKSGDPIDIGKQTLVQITGKKPNARNAKKSQRDWGVRKGEPIGVAVTVRGNDATELLKKLLVVKDNQIAEKAFDNEGNFSFGIREHIDIPGIKYDPKLGILGFEGSISFARPGFSIIFNKNKAKVGINHRITKNDAIKFLTEEFGVKVVLWSKIDHLEIVEPVIHLELKEKLEEVLDGVKDVVIIQQLFKNMTYTYVDDVLEK